MAKEFPAPPELERRLQALDRAVRAPDVPAMMRASGVNVSRTFEYEDIENIDIRSWSIEGMSFRGARLVNVIMTPEQALLIRKTEPREFCPVIELMVGEAEYIPSPVEDEAILRDPWEEALRRIDRVKQFRLPKLNLAGLKLDRLPDEINELDFLLFVNLQDTGVTDLAPLSSMAQMTSLNLNNTGITDLAPLANMTAMNTLNLGGTSITDLAPLASMTAMNTLVLHNTRVADLSPLAGMGAMNSLTLNRTHVSNLGPLAGMTEMTTLSLAATRVNDLLPLAGITAMIVLNLRDTNVTDLTPLRDMTDLKRINLSRTPVESVIPLLGCRSLIEVTLNSFYLIGVRALRDSGVRIVIND